MLNIFDWMRGTSVGGQTATKLYGSIVAQAREPVFFTHFGVRDVAEKRYELIVLHLVLVLERLAAAGAPGRETAQALVESFVRDLDGSIREMAVSDTKVPAKVRKAAGGLMDRDQLYRQSFEDHDAAGVGVDEMTTGGLIDELIFDGATSSKSTAMLHYVMAARLALAGWALADGTDRLPFPEADGFLEGAL